MMNKFKLFLILMLTTFISVPNVDAIVNIGGTAFEQSPQVNFYDNTNGSLTSAGSSFYSSQGYWTSNDNIITNGTWVNGANIALTVNTTFVAGYTYSLSLLIGMEFTSVHGSTPRVCIAENINNAVTRFQNPNFSCTNAFSTVAMDGVANFDYNGNSFSYGMLTYVFTADFTSPTITVVYQSNGGANNSRHVFGGYHLETIAQPNNGLTQSQVQSIINNSGLASAESVAELETEIQNVKEEINTSTQEQIESQKVCNYIDYSNVIQHDTIMDVNGLISKDPGNYGLTDYINIQKSDITVVSTVTGVNPSLCFYNVNKNLISCIKNNTLTVNQKISIPNNATYVRFTISKINNAPTFKICKNGNQALNDSVNDLNDNITSSDTSESESQANSFFEGFESDDYGLSDIVTMPLELIRGLTNNSCVALNLTLPFVNKTFQLPCMSSIYQQYFGDFFTLYQTITFGFIAYWVIVKIFALVKGFKDPNDDKVEVLDL